MTTTTRYPSDIDDDEWAFVAPYLALVDPDAPQRRHNLREVFNALRWIVRTGAPWRYLPQHFPPWQAVYQQTQRWIKAHVFEEIAYDLRILLRGVKGRKAHPSAAIFDASTLISTPESGHRAGYDGAKKRRGSKLHIAVDTLGHLLALLVTAASEQERAQVGALCEQVQQMTRESVKVAFVDQGYTGDQAKEAATAAGIELEVIKHVEAKRGFVLLPRRWVVERSFAWVRRFRRLAKDYERLPETVAGLHFLAYVCLMLPKMVAMIEASP